MYLEDIRQTDTLTADPEVLISERHSLKEQVVGDFTLRDEAAGLVQSALKAVHMAGQSHASDPIASMLGMSNDSDLEDINRRLAFIGVQVDSISELTPWSVAYLIVDIVTQVFNELSEDLPTL